MKFCAEKGQSRSPPIAISRSSSLYRSPTVSPTPPGLAVNSDLLCGNSELCWSSNRSNRSNRSSRPLGVLELRSLGQTPMASVWYPAVPPQASYTSCYCEENIYLLAASFLEKPDLHKSWDLSVVFVSNCTKTASDHFHPPPRPRQGVPGGLERVLFIQFFHLLTRCDSTVLPR